MTQAQDIQSNPAKAAGFEIDDIDSSVIDRNTFNVAVIEDADGEPISGFVIVGKNSAEYQAATVAIRAANIKRSAKRAKAIDTSTDEGAATVASTIASNERAIAMAVIVDWFGFNSEGQPASFDRSKVEKMLSKFPQWQARVNAALEVDANFMKV
jgi:hypothetical protein